MLYADKDTRSSHLKVQDLGDSSTASDNSDKSSGTKKKDDGKLVKNKKKLTMAQRARSMFGLGGRKSKKASKSPGAGVSKSKSSADLGAADTDDSDADSESASRRTSTREWLRQSVIQEISIDELQKKLDTQVKNGEPVNVDDQIAL